MARLLIAVLLAAAPASAGQDALAELRAKVEAAALQMDADPQGAAEVLDHLAVDSIELRRARALTTAEREVHARLFVLRGRVHLQLLANERAEESFRELLRIAPLYAGELAPLEQQMVDALRQREGGVLEVTSGVPNAYVFVDGVRVGVSGDLPVRVAIVAGTYEVRVERARFKPGVRRAAVAAGETTAVSVDPVRDVPPLVFVSDRDEVELTADGVSLGRLRSLTALRTGMTADESTALERFIAAAGLDARTVTGLLIRNPDIDRSITIRFSRECFIEDTRVVAVTSAMLDQLDPAQPIVWLGDASILRLAPDVGTLRIQSTPSDADVFLDGQFAGRTPFERDVCVGPHRVRIRHRIGSYNIATTIRRGRTNAIDVPLKPDLAFLGAVDEAGRPAPEAAAAIDRSLAATLTTFHLTGRLDLPPEARPWSDTETAGLVDAAGRGDHDAVARLLKLAVANYDAPLLLAAVRHAGTAGTGLDLLVFWSGHTGVDRLAVPGTGDREIAAVLERLNGPADAEALLYGTDIGLRAADTGLAAAPLLVVAVRPGSAAAAAGIRPGDAIAAADGTAVTASQLASRVASRKPGDLLALRIASPDSAVRELTVAAQQRARLAPAFDTAWPGNALLARLTAQAYMATTPADRSLLGVNLAAAYMRFGEWKTALSHLATLTGVPPGDGVGPGVATFLAARCHEELGDRERAVALYRELLTATAEIAADDGTTVAALARYRLAALGGG